jgi:hypothetical protein
MFKTIQLFKKTYNKKIFNHESFINIFKVLLKENKKIIINKILIGCIMKLLRNYGKYYIKLILMDGVGNLIMMDLLLEFVL